MKCLLHIKQLFLFMLYVVSVLNPYFHEEIPFWDDAKSATPTELVM